MFNEIIDKLTQLYDVIKDKLTSEYDVLQSQINTDPTFMTKLLAGVILLISLPFMVIGELIGRIVDKIFGKEYSGPTGDILEDLSLGGKIAAAIKLPVIVPGLLIAMGIDLTMNGLATGINLPINGISTTTPEIPSEKIEEMDHKISDNKSTFFDKIKQNF